MLVPTRLRTTGQALYALNWMGVAGILGGLVGGGLFDHYGANMLYIVSSVMSIAGMAGFVGLWLYARVRQVGADDEVTARSHHAKS